MKEKAGRFKEPPSFTDKMLVFAAVGVGQVT